MLQFGVRLFNSEMSPQLLARSQAVMFDDSISLIVSRADVAMVSGQGFKF